MPILANLRKSEKAFTFLGAAVAVALYLPAGFLSGTIIVFVLYCFISAGPKPIDQVKANPTLLMPVLLYLIGVIWVIFSDDRHEAFPLLGKKIPLLLLPIGIIIIGRKITAKQFQYILASFLAGGPLSSLVCYGVAVYNILSHHTIIDPNSDHTSYYFAYIPLVEAVNMDPIYLGLYCNFAFTIAIQTPLIRKTWLRLGVLIYITIFIILIASKIGIITLALTGVIWVLMTKKGIVSFVLLSIIVMAVVVGIYSSSFLKERFTTSTQFNYPDPDGSHWSSATVRLAIWSCAIDAVASKPVMGYGTGSGQKALEDVYKKREFALGTFWSYNAHNEFLITALDTGIFGLCVLCIMLISPLIKSIGSGDRITTFFIIIVSLCFLIEGVLLRQRGIVFFAFFYTLLIWHSNAEQPVANERT